jgi:hypothetical protein
MNSGQSCSRYSLIYYFGRNCRFVTHYYAKGDHCKESGKQRDVQLRFKCVTKQGISIYLQEPTVCKYILTLESPHFCSRIEDAKDNGLFNE